MSTAADAPIERNIAAIERDTVTLDQTAATVASRQALRRVLFVNRYFHPDLSATSQMLTDLVRRLQARGFELHVISSRQRYEDPNARLAREDWLEAVRVHRVRSARFGRRRLIGRAIDYLGFYVNAMLAMLRWTRPGDIIVAMTDPPLLSVCAAIVAKRRHAVLINWLQDVFPEIAESLGVLRLPRAASSVVRGVRDWSLRAADRNVVIGTGMYSHICRLGIGPTKQRVIENWADGETLSPMPAASSTLRRSLPPGVEFVVEYSGNLGRAHDYATILEAATALRAEREWLFLMIGGGEHMHCLRLEVERRGLENVRFLPYQPRETLPDSLAAADVHLSCLLPSLEGLVVPSKFYGILAAGRPVVVIGDPDGEQARIVRGEGCGAVVCSGDAHGLVDELRRMHSDPEWMRTAGEQARISFERRYTLDKASGEWLAILRDVEARRRL